ncbi:MAG: hypothetical protein AAF539_03840 [Planctomycetota bacterium]
MSITTGTVSWRRWILGVLACVAVVALGCGASVWVAVQQTQHVPEFYSEAITRTEQDRQLAKQHLQRDFDQLRTDASRHGQWIARFDEEQITAWLSEHLPEKFSKWIHLGVRDPVIAIREGQLLAAVRFASKRIDTVVSCQMQVCMTEEPNLLAVRLSNLRAGSFPLPLEPFVRNISREAALGDLEVRWDLTNDGPIALVKIPHEHEKYVIQPVVIESVDLIGGRLRLSGQTGSSATTSFSPRGPMHRFVRYRTPDDESLTRL